MSLGFETVDYEIEDKLAWITLNRPDQLNAFAGDMREELLQCLLQAQEDDRVKVVVVTGKGRAFSAGGDVKHMVALKEEKAGFDQVRPLLDQGRQVVTVVHQMPKPVIAMVNGPAAGAGCSLALACDMRIASDSSYFSVSHIQIGLHPDWGGTFFLPRLVGVGRALEMMWTGRRIEAEEAEEIGLVHQVVPQGHLVEHTTRFARRLAKAPGNAVRLIKLAVYNSAHYDLDGMLEYECEAQQQCWESTESHEGIRAFAERRRPTFDRR